MDYNLLLVVIQLQLSELLALGPFRLASVSFQHAPPPPCVLNTHFLAPHNVPGSSCILPVPALLLFIGEQGFETKIWVLVVLIATWCHCFYLGLLNKARKYIYVCCYVHTHTCILLSTHLYIH